MNLVITLKYNVTLKVSINSSLSETIKYHGYGIQDI